MTLSGAEASACLQSSSLAHSSLVTQLDDLCIDIWVSVMIQIAERQGTAMY